MPHEPTPICEGCSLNKINRSFRDVYLNLVNAQTRQLALVAMTERAGVIEDIVEEAEYRYKFTAAKEMGECLTRRCVVPIKCEFGLGDE